MGTPLASVVIRSKNDIAFIGKTLEALRAQDLADFELLCVDSGSTDGTWELLEARKPDLAWRVKPEDYIPGKVLNDAVRRCSGKIVVFNNSDCVPLDKQWLGNLIHPLLADQTLGAVFGNQLPRPDAAPLVAKDHARAFGDGKDAATWGHFFSLATSAAPRELLLQVPFDESLRYSEDVEWSWRVKRSGRSLRYVPEARVEHSHNYSPPELRKRFYNEGYAEGQIHRGCPPWLSGFVLPCLREMVRDLLYLSRRGLFGAIPGGWRYRLAQRANAWSGRRAAAAGRPNKYFTT